MGRVVGTDYAQRTCVVELAQQQGAAGVFIERAVVGFDACGRQQLGHDALVLVRALAQVDRGEVEAEHLSRAHQGLQTWHHERLRMVRDQRGFDRAQVGKELGGRVVGVLRRHGVAQGLGAGEFLQRGGQARVHADQGAAVGFILAVGVLVGRALGQRLHRGRDRRQHLRHRQLAAQVVHLGEVEAQHGLALA